MHDWFFKHSGRKRLIDWLGIDSWIDSALANSWNSVLDRWNAVSSFFARFRLSGWKRLLNEAVAEGLTIGTGGLAVLYVLALPALNEFDENRINQGKYAVKFLDRNGVEIGQRGILHNDAVPLEEVPDHLIKATLATEDRRFFEHFGVDFIGTARALMENARANEVVQGGSTLTQQLAKNLFLSSERSVTRKVKEVFLAFLLESRLTKRQILKLYLDRAYLGGGAYGVEAASQFYFAKSVRDINLAEAAVLAGLFKAPSKFAPHVNLPASRARTNDVLTNLVEAGYMSAGQVHAARLNPAKIIDTRPTHSPDWFLDWAFEEAQRLGEGRGHYVLTARTTVDLGMQQSAQDAMVNTLRHTGSSRKRGYTGALVSMEPDGAVRAMVGGLDYEDNQFNRASHARRQPGSSFKLYVYATAFENGLNPRSTVRDYGGACGNWAPKNYSGGSSGRSLAAIDAFRMSLNIPAVEVSLRPNVGRDRVLEMTRRLGVVGVKKTCSMALGDTGITPLQHTGAYAHFANGGKTAKPYGILEMYNSKGDLIYTRDRDEPPPRAGRKPQGRRRDEPDDAGGRHERHGRQGAARFRHRRRQDRHQLELSRCLVRRLHRGAGDGGMGRLRRLPPDARHHRRQPADPGLAQLHAGGAAELPHHPARSRASPRIPTSPLIRASPICGGKRTDPGQSQAQAAETAQKKIEPDARADADGTEAPRRQHAAGRRSAAHARQRRRSGNAGAASGRARCTRQAAAARAEGEARSFRCPSGARTCPRGERPRP